MGLLPTFLRVAVNDLSATRHRIRSPRVHLRAAAEWLARAQDVTPDGGVSYGYTLVSGWRHSYVETTGYIVPSFFDLAAAFDVLDAELDLRSRAIRMVGWLRSVQRDDGSFTNERFARADGIVFDTGQVLFGLTRAYSETRDTNLSEVIDRAANWLVREAADETGRWTRHTHLGIPHVYNTRVAWALLEANRHRANPEWERVARVNLDWAVGQERDGWFEQCAFEPDVAPFTHTIAYAIRGLWESGRLLSHSGYQEAARRAADAMVEMVRDDGFVPGQIDVRGRPAARYCCLTGNCQLAIIWADLFAHTKDERYRRAASQALLYVLATQDLATSHDNIRGAIKGSQPLWGRYAPLSFPNWATKFLVDALLRCEGWLE